MICTGFMVHIVYHTENENQSVDVEFPTAMIASDTCAILAHPRTLGHGTSRIVLLAAAFNSTRCLPKMKTPCPWLHVQRRNSAVFTSRSSLAVV
jgi:hypothetical protein